MTGILITLDFKAFAGCQTVHARLYRMPFRANSCERQPRTKALGRSVGPFHGDLPTSLSHRFHDEAHVAERSRNAILKFLPNRLRIVV
jgi:hypothetical protein